MDREQPGILPPVPDQARYLEFGTAPGSDAAAVLRALRSGPIDESTVIGLVSPLIILLGRSLPQLRPFPALTGPGCAVPSTQAALWCWLHGSDRGRLVHADRAFRRLVGSALSCDRVVDGFRFGRGLDLSGYEDGTENPKGEAARSAALVQASGSGLDGSSFVAVQQWLHDLDRVEMMAQDERDRVVGRRQSDNVELPEAPAPAHVKRTAQESFDPPAFVVRRSMPWADPAGEGLMFVAFGATLDAFEAQLRRMTGQADGVVDRLFLFTRPISGSYFWCPPAPGGTLDLSALGL